jgi:uncharacterized membrane protein
MIISFELAQVIERPIDQVFSFLSDFSNMTYWNYYIQRVTKISQKDIGLGSTFEMKRPHDLNIYKIVAYDPSKSITFELQAPGPNLQLEFSFSSHNLHTHIIYAWHLNLEKYKLLKYLPGGLIKRLILYIPKRIILTKTRPAVEENFKKLKQLMEKGEVILQDGRLVTLEKKQTTS